MGTDGDSWGQMGPLGDKGTSVFLSCSLTVYTARLDRGPSPGEAQSGAGLPWWDSPPRVRLAAGPPGGGPGSPHPCAARARRDRRASPGPRQGRPGPHAA